VYSDIITIAGSVTRHTSENGISIINLDAMKREKNGRMKIMIVI